MELADIADLKSVGGSLPGSNPGTRILRSSYVRGIAASRMDRKFCAYCGNSLLHQRLGERRSEFMFTRDHILPLELGRSLAGVRNKRPSCADCNQKRAKWKHCTGFMMMVLLDGAISRLGKWEAIRYIANRTK